MSVNVRNKTITLTRGDTMRLQVGMSLDGQPYEPEMGDVVRFAVKHQKLNDEKTEYVDPEPLLIKEVPIDTLILELAPDDTKGLGFGAYAFDLQITFADGTVDTFVSGTLVLTPEVD